MIHSENQKNFDSILHYDHELENCDSDSLPLFNMDGVKKMRKNRKKFFTTLTRHPLSPVTLEIIPEEQHY